VSIKHPAYLFPCPASEFFATGTSQGGWPIISYFNCVLFHINLPLAAEELWVSRVIGSTFLWSEYVSPVEQIAGLPSLDINDARKFRKRMALPVAAEPEPYK
jgi:hypothetical protein